ncbi:uncharacterized protein LOC116188771 [Punica granatum]|uniref:Uncharacterized protein LOC116188771 n=1 Tax=Punica granatum TaxID=22663 RepID=A0A6P8BY10_PUNGR|nr:uncharacterized protein LOC116188771 [Punica granatum]
MASASRFGSVSGRNTRAVAKSWKNATGVRDDPAWAHDYEVLGERLKIKCKYCDKIVSGGPYRLKHHLGCTKINVTPCPVVPNDVKNNMCTISMRLEDLSAKKKQASSCGLEGDDVVDVDNDDEDEGVDTKGKGNETIKISSFFNKRSLDIQSKQKQLTINQMMKKDLREDVCMQIARFFYTSAIPFNCVKNPEFEKMCHLIGKYGIGLKPPSYHEISNKYLRKEVDNTMSLLEEHKVMWRKSMSSIMLDGWTDKKKRSICNFLVNSPKGTIFLTSNDTSDISKTAVKVFEMIDDIVEQVGEENVVQIVTDNAVNYNAACEMLMEKRNKLFWTSCVAHCIDLMLKDLEKKIKVHELMIMKGRKITTFIYSRTLLITMLKYFTKGKDLIKPAMTRFATAYLTLGCLFDNRNALRTMFASKQWKVSRFAKLEGGKYAERVIMDNKVWSNVNTYLKATYPLIKVLRMVDSDEKPAMGFIYSEMEKAKQKIKTNFKDDRKSYDPIWKLKDKKIRKQVDLQVEDISSDDEWIVENETENIATLSHNFNLRSLGRGDDGDEESGGIQIGAEHAKNMRTQEHGTIDDLELYEEDEFDILYDDDEYLDEI